MNDNNNDDKYDKDDNGNNDNSDKRMSHSKLSYKTCHEIIQILLPIKYCIVNCQIPISNLQ